MMEINENKIRLSGVSNLSQKPSRTNIFVDMTIKNATIIDDIDFRGNEDGTYNAIYKLKITEETEINILVENEIIKAKKKGSQSQVLKQVLQEWYSQQFCGGEDYKDFEEFYKSEMTKIINEKKINLI